MHQSRPWLRDRNNQRARADVMRFVLPLALQCHALMAFSGSCVESDSVSAERLHVLLRVHGVETGKFDSVRTQDRLHVSDKSGGHNICTTRRDDLGARNDLIAQDRIRPGLR